MIKFFKNIRNLIIVIILFFFLSIAPSHQVINCNNQLTTNTLKVLFNFQDQLQSLKLIHKYKGTYTIPPNRLTQAQHHQNQEILTNLKSFQRLTENYIHQLKSTKPAPSSALLMASFIRSGKKQYSGSAWNALAGMEEDYFSYINMAKGNECAYFLRKVEYLYDPVTGEKIDFIHMMATLNVYLKNGLIYNLYPQVGDIGGWAGDCIQLAREGRNEIVKTKDLKAYYSKRLGIEGTFGIGDVLADIDALNIYVQLKNKKNIPAIMEYYYSSLAEKDRYQLFLQNRFKEVTSKKELMKEIRKVLTRKSYLMTLVLKRESLDMKRDKRYLEEAGDCFASYLWNMRVKDKK